MDILQIRNQILNVLCHLNADDQLEQTVSYISTTVTKMVAAISMLRVSAPELMESNGADVTEVQFGSGKQAFPKPDMQPTAGAVVQDSSQSRSFGDPGFYKVFEGFPASDLISRKAISVPIRIFLVI